MEAIYRNTLTRKKTELELQIGFMKLFRRDQKFDVTSYFITSKNKFLNVENFMNRGTITYIHETEINRCSMRVYMQKAR